MTGSGFGFCLESLEAISPAVAAAGLASGDELGRTIDALYEFGRADNTVMTPARVVQVWGRNA